MASLSSPPSSPLRSSKCKKAPEKIAIELGFKLEIATMALRNTGFTLMQTETIAAIATAPGQGAIAIVRISGPEALSITDAMFNKDVHSYKTHTAHHGKVLAEDGSVIDDVLLLVMHEGRSFTGEATAEIMCHGGSIIAKKILARSLQLGARPAGPGEFSFRAYQNGKIDLAQAEAIQQLIAAKNEYALEAAERQLSGQLSVRIREIQKEITDITAIIEAWVDYPEEGLEFASDEEMQEMISAALDKMRLLATSFTDGKRFSECPSICLLGSPNVGKSSLMNSLLDEDRAIVTHIAGTTRDILEEEVIIGSMTFRLIDTAGIRETDEVIESEGIRRSKLAAERADLKLIVIDVTRNLSAEERALIELFPDALIVLNKIDLPHQEISVGGLKVSAKTFEGIDALKNTLKDLVWDRSLIDKEEPILTQQRHFNALSRAIGFMESVQNSLSSDTSPEFLTMDLRSALHELASIIGMNVTEDVLGAIFSKFCVGK